MRVSRHSSVEGNGKFLLVSYLAQEIFSGVTKDTPQAHVRSCVEKVHKQHQNKTNSCKNLYSSSVKEKYHFCPVVGLTLRTEYP